MLLAVLLMCASAASFAAEEGKPKLIVLEFSVAGGADPTVAKALAESVTTEISRRGYYQVISAGDVQTLLGVERQKELLGCSEEAKSCLTELAGALGAQFVLSGSLSRFGSLNQLNLQTLDSTKAQPIGRSTRLAPSLEGLRAEVPVAVAEATGTPLPPPPSRVLPVTLLSLGTASLLAGGALGFYAINNDTALSRELESSQRGAALRPADEYQSEVAAIGMQRTLSVAAMGLGAALLAAGIFTMPSTAVGETNLALVPSTNGFALVGVTR